MLLHDAPEDRVPKGLLQLRECLCGAPVVQFFDAGETRVVDYERLKLEPSPRAVLDSTSTPTLLQNVRRDPEEPACSSSFVRVEALAAFKGTDERFGR